jgi:hypothetical protein
MIRIEIISVTDQEVGLALYYPVPAHLYSVASKDPSRVPLGNGLNAQELQDLKDGKLFELEKSVSPEAKTQAEMRAAIEKTWDSSKSQAKTAYKQAYSYMNLPNLVGKKWDGNSWS